MYEQTAPTSRLLKMFDHLQGQFDRERYELVFEAGGAPSFSEVVATVYKDGSALYVEPLPPQAATCFTTAAQVGCPVSRVYYGFADITAEQQADAEWNYRGRDLQRNTVLLMGQHSTVTVRDHSTDTVRVETWFIVDRLYRSPFRGRITESHSSEYFFTSGTTTNAQVLAISRGEQTTRAAQINWTGLAASGTGGPTTIDDMYVTGQTNYSASPLIINADECFLRQTR